MLLAKAPSLTILIPVRDGNGVLRFPHDDGPYYGLHRLIDSSETLANQAKKAASEFLDCASDGFIPVTAVDPVLRKDGEVSSILYILRPVGDAIKSENSWPTIAEILRSLPQGQTRLAYMKALQYLAGAADAEVSVLEVDEEVRARLREQQQPDR